MSHRIHRAIPAVLTATALALSACVLPLDELDQLGQATEERNGTDGEDSSLNLEARDMQDPVFDEAEISGNLIQGPIRMPDGIELAVSLLRDESRVASVSLRYRLVGSWPDQSSDPVHVAITDQVAGTDLVMFQADLPQFGAEAMQLFDDGWGQLEY